MGSPNVSPPPPPLTTTRMTKKTKTRKRRPRPKPLQPPPPLSLETPTFSREFSPPRSPTVPPPPPTASLLPPRRNTALSDPTLPRTSTALPTTFESPTYPPNRCSCSHVNSRSRLLAVPPRTWFKVPALLDVSLFSSLGKVLNTPVLRLSAFCQLLPRPYWPG